MKLSLNEIINKLKKIMSFNKMKINLHIYWRNLLYAFFVVILILILFSFYLLSEIKNQQIFQVTTKPAERISLMNEKLLDKINKSFAGKVAKEKEIIDGLIIYKDPSLK